jgi:glyoxylase-like metal-dependent hydrolase (beta-lactamase superfamily II)
MLDGGSSPAHARLLLDELPQRPSIVVYTHSHWDHVFGGASTGARVAAHRLTATNLEELARRDWSDEANVGEHIREELPAPREVEIAAADIVFDSAVDFDLGGVTVHVEHVGGDHCDDACVALIEPDRILFAGDALYAGPGNVMTVAKAFPLFERILAFPADRYVEGHHDAVSTRSELEALFRKAREAEAGRAEAGDEDAAYFAAAFTAGRDLH